MNGIDVSVHQGKINWDIVKSKNLQTIIVRCAYGGYQDKTSDFNMKEANKRNLTVGAYDFVTYHYSENSNMNNALDNARAEANRFVAILKKYTINSYVALDFEFESGKNTVLTKDKLTECANVFMGILKTNGYIPLLYTSVATLYQYFNVDKLKYDFWLAYYTNAGFNSNNFPNDKYGNMMKPLASKIKMWQFTSSLKGSDYGMSSARLDGNHVYGICRFNDVGTIQQSQSQPIQQTTPQQQQTKWKIGDVVTYSTCYRASTDTIDKHLKIGGTGRITHIKYGTNNPYLIENGRCWVNDGDIRNGDTKPTSTISKPQQPQPQQTIKVNDKVKVINAINYDNGKKFTCYYSTYIVSEVKGNRAVIGVYVKDKFVVTSAIDVKYIQKV